VAEPGQGLVVRLKFELTEEVKNLLQRFGHLRKLKEVSIVKIIVSLKVSFILKLGKETNFKILILWSESDLFSND